MFFAALIILLSNCSQNNGLILKYREPAIFVGPTISYSKYYGGADIFSNDPSLPIVKPDVGYLKVHAYKNSNQFDLDKDCSDISFLPYQIFQKDRRSVENNNSTYNAPEIFALHKGEYVVVVCVAKDQIKSLLVKIEPGMITEIDPSTLMLFASK